MSEDTSYAMLIMNAPRGNPQAQQGPMPPNDSPRKDPWATWSPVGVSWGPTVSPWVLLGTHGALQKRPARAPLVPRNWCGRGPHYILWVGNGAMWASFWPLGPLCPLGTTVLDPWGIFPCPSAEKYTFYSGPEKSVLSYKTGKK